MDAEFAYGFLETLSDYGAVVLVPAQQLQSVKVAALFAKKGIQEVGNCTYEFTEVQCDAAHSNHSAIVRLFEGWVASGNQRRIAHIAFISCQIPLTNHNTLVIDADYCRQYPYEPQAIFDLCLQILRTTPTQS